jgi:hypothetical protein
VLRPSLLVVAGCWSAPAPPPPPVVAAPPANTGPFELVIDRAERCDYTAVVHAGIVHACQHAFDLRTGTYAGRTHTVIAALPDGRLIARPDDDHDGLDVGARHFEQNHVYKTALSPDGKHFAYIAEHFQPQYHQTIVVRETARWTVEYEVAHPRYPTESINTAIGWLHDRLMVTVASPTCLARNPCAESRIAEVTAHGVARNGGDLAASWVAFAPDGSAVAVADRVRVRVFASLDAKPLASLELARDRLDGNNVRGLAVATGGRLLALSLFDRHGVVVYEKDDRRYAPAGTFPKLGGQLVFAGDTLLATGFAYGVVRRTRTPPRFEFPALAIDASGFEVEDCADAHPKGFYCGHQLRARYEAPGVTIAIYVSPTSEFARVPSLDAWTALMRDRFEVAPRDIREKVDLGLRAWQTPRGRQLEFHHQIRESCSPADEFVRFAEVDGWLWRVEIEVPPDAPQPQVDPLLARFIDDWLGAPPVRIARQLPAPPAGTVLCGTL